MFLLVGLLASGLIIADRPSIKLLLLLVIAIWSYCRLYYFAFYVIERYVDNGYRFSGLGSFVSFVIQRQKSK